MLRTLAINSNQFVLSFGVLIAFWSPKQSKFEESYLESMAKQWKSQKHKEPKVWSFKFLCHKQSGMQGGEVKKISAMKHSWWQSFQPLLEHFLKSNLYMLYFVSKITKSKIQCIKRFANRSWNEEVRAIGSRSLQAEGQFRRAAKSFRSHLVCLRNFAAILCACEILLSASKYLRPTLLDILLQIFDV